MKKLVIALGAVVFAAGVQAASVTWASGVFKTPVDANGGWSTANVASGSVSGYLWSVTAAEYAAMYSTDVTTMMGNVLGEYATITDGKITGVKSGSIAPTASTTAVTLKDTASYSSGDTAYAVIVYTYTDASDNQFYIANVGSWEFSANQNKTISNMAINLGGTSTTSLGGWQSVPEPTSGLLILLGMAGLALRRRRA